MKFSVIFLFALLILSSCSSEAKNNPKEIINGDREVMNNPNIQTAIFGGGCFWCVEAVFQELEGVEKVESGYAGGHKENPTYKEVCTGTTGHAEVTKIYYDTTKITFEELLLVFFSTHDPTTLNRQGADVGTQYRSVVYFQNEKEKTATLNMINKLTDEKVFPSKIVTEVSPLSNYFPAEDYHQNYFALNPNQAYCSAVINPKITKFKKQFKEKLKH